MMASRPRGRIVLLALISMAGIVGMLLANGAWDWLFLGLAALPLLIAGGALGARKAWATFLRWCDEYQAGDSR